MNAGEQLISDVTAYISELVPIHIDKVKNKLSAILAKYQVKKVEQTEIHPDLTEKIELFLSAKKLEGLSKNSLDSYKLELRIFADKVKKRTIDVTAADIRIFLSQFDHLKLSSVSKKLSVLKDIELSE